MEIRKRERMERERERDDRYKGTIMERIGKRNNEGRREEEKSGRK